MPNQLRWIWGCAAVFFAVAPNSSFALTTDELYRRIHTNLSYLIDCTNPAKVSQKALCGGCVSLRYQAVERDVRLLATFDEKAAREIRNEQLARFKSSLDGAPLDKLAALCAAGETTPARLAVQGRHVHEIAADTQRMAGDFWRASRQAPSAALPVASPAAAPLQGGALSPAAPQGSRPVN